MKGVLVGTFYAIVGSNCILGMERRYLGKYPPVISWVWLLSSVHYRCFDRICFVCNSCE